MSITEIAEKNAHISDTEIEQDIADTEREIAEWKREAEHLAATPYSSPDVRWNHMRASARESRIAEAEQCIAKLKAILEYRRKAEEKH